jgi:hypothetical protein
VVEVLDLSDREHPHSAGSCRLAALAEERDALVLWRDHLLVLERPGIEVFDLSAPNDPRLVSRYAMEWIASSLSIAGDYAFVFGGPFGPEIFDLVDASGFRWESTWKDGPNSGTVVGGLMFSAMWPGGVEIRDVSDALHPKLIGEVKTESYTAGIAGDGERLLLGSDRSLEAVDITEPTNPKWLGKYQGDPAAFWGPQLPGVTVDGNFIYVAAGPAGLRILETESGRVTRQVAAHRTESAALSVTVLGSYVYVGTVEGAEIFKMNSPSEVQHLATYQAYKEQEGWELRTTAIAAAGDYLYLAGRGLEVVDISNVQSPARIATMGRRELPAIADLKVSGGLVFAVYSVESPFCCLWGGLLVLDARNAADLQIIGRYQSKGFARVDGKVALRGNFAFLSVTDELSVLDVSSPSLPEVVAEYRDAEYRGFTMADNWGVATRFGRVDAPGDQYALTVLDLSDALHPRSLGGSEQLHRGAGVVVSGRLVCQVSRTEISFFEVGFGVPGAPGIRKAGKKIELFWPSAEEGAVLEETGALEEKVEWRNAEVSLEQIDEEVRARVEASDRKRYFRLKK